MQSLFSKQLDENRTKMMSGTLRNYIFTHCLQIALNKIVLNDEI